MPVDVMVDPDGKKGYPGEDVFMLGTPPAIIRQAFAMMMELPESYFNGPCDGSLVICFAKSLTDALLSRFLMLC
jgi:hypothetical protein